MTDKVQHSIQHRLGLAAQLRGYPGAKTEDPEPDVTIIKPQSRFDVVIYRGKTAFVEPYIVEACVKNGSLHCAYQLTAGGKLHRARLNEEAWLQVALPCHQ